MKKIIFILLVLLLLFTAGCKEISENDQEADSDEQGYITNLDNELNTSDLDSLDEDLDLDWI